MVKKVKGSPLRAVGMDALEYYIEFENLSPEEAYEKVASMNETGPEPWYVVVLVGDIKVTSWPTSAYYDAWGDGGQTWAEAVDEEFAEYLSRIFV